MRITVIGTGYVGIVHAACLSDVGHEVLGVDIDEERIAALSQARAPIYEPGLDDLLARSVTSGRLRFTTSLSEAARFAGTHFICVGTPQQAGSHAADLRHVEAVVDELGPMLLPGDVLVGKSTVPVGTAARLAERTRTTAPDVEIAWNPEFLREGSAVNDSQRPERLVVGVTSRHAEGVLREVYAPQLRNGVQLIVTDPSTAELVKEAANSFLATKISFINAMSEVCDASGADVLALAAAIGADSRIGPHFLEPGLGFGGSCFPKDIRGFTARARELGVGDAVGFLREVDAINARQRGRTVELAERLLEHSFAGRNVAVLGAAFKPGSDDVRDSPALAVATAIQRRGARVRVHDPQAVDNARAAAPDLQFTLDVDKACEEADLVLLLTAWPEYRQIDPAALATVVHARHILDARHALDASSWRLAGWTLHALGRPRLAAATEGPSCASS